MIIHFLNNHTSIVMILNTNGKANAKAPTKRVIWVDIAKLIAMIAVIVDHSYGYLYSNINIGRASYFSVSLFVLLSGISTWISSNGEKNFKKAFKRAGKLFISYAVATLVLLIFYYRHFDLRLYISHIINFSITAPYYFFLFFLQLIFITPILTGCINYINSKKYKILIHIMTIFLIGVVCAVCINYTYILPVHGGGQYLFGGTYLLVYYIGMMLASLDVFNMTLGKRIITLICSVIGGTIWLGMILMDKLPFDIVLSAFWGGGFNPPSINLIVYSLALLFFIYSIVTLLEDTQNKYIEICLKFLAFF